MTANRVIPPVNNLDPDGTYDSRYIRITSATDSDSVALTVDDETLQADVQFDGTGSADTAARSDHDHDTDYADIATESTLSNHIAAIDTDPSDPHHTLGAGANQAAAGNHTHAHSALTGIGTNTHAQIDTAVTNSVAHIAATSAHGVAGDIVGTTDTQTLTNKTLDTSDIYVTFGKSFIVSAGAATFTVPATSWGSANHSHSSTASGGTINHNNLTNNGSNTHAQIDAHIADIDSDPSDPHHTLGVGANQAAAGNHTHAGVYQPVVATPPFIALTSETENTTPNNTTLATVIADTAMSSALPTGTWAVPITISGQLRRSAGTTSYLQLMVNGSLHTELTFSNLSTTYKPFRRVVQVTGLTGTPTFGLRHRAGPGGDTTYIEMASLSGTDFRRTA